VAIAARLAAASERFAMLPKLLSVSACVFGFIYVALSAVGSHVLRLDAIASKRMDIALSFLIVHAIVLLLIRIPPKAHEFRSRLNPGAAFAGLAFLFGTVLFCGSLIALALGAPHWLSKIAPLGGSLLMLAWLLWGLSFLRSA
jgi:uncharacterized membrane protein YgdD (TMEM256/DUF423 family)